MKKELWNTKLYYFIENGLISQAIEEMRKMPKEELNIGFINTETGTNFTHLYKAIDEGLTTIAHILIDKGCHIGIG